MKNCSQGTKLYSPIAGDIKFNKIIESEGLGCYIAVETNYGRLLFDSEGKTYEDGECLLFPSKEQRDWNKFKSASIKEGNSWVWIDLDNNPLNKEIKYWTIIKKLYN